VSQAACVRRGSAPPQRGIYYKDKLIAMMTRRQKKQYLELEERLEKKFKNVRENELILTKDDFKDGKLRSSSFTKLKDECWYIPYEDDVEIKLPKRFEAGFRDSLEFFSTREISKVKKDRNEDRVQAVILFLTGIAILAVAFVAYLAWDVMIVTELFTIISWVFIWAAVTKWFIDRRELRDQRFTLLQMLSARIISVEDEENCC